MPRRATGCRPNRRALGDVGQEERTLKRPIGTVLVGGFPGAVQAQALLGMR